MAADHAELVFCGRPLDRWLEERGLARQDVFELPRKFKVSLSACAAACGQPWINDLGFVAAQRDGRWGLRVIVAGSLGARPCTGIEWIDWIAPGEAVPCALAALTVFATHGDRQNRARARS